MEISPETRLVIRAILRGLKLIVSLLEKIDRGEDIPNL